MKRNFKHILIGFALGYALTMLFGFPNRVEFPYDWRLYLAPIFACIPVGFIAGVWEYRQDKIRSGAYDINDVYRTMIGCYFGGLLSLFFANLLLACVLLGFIFWLIVKELKG